MHLLGRHLPDHKLLRIALTNFYGIGHHTSGLLLHRLSIPLATKVSDLTEGQVTALSAFLSSPSTSPRPDDTPLPSSSSSGASTGTLSMSPVVADEGAAGKRRAADPLEGLRIETDLRRGMQADIAHQRQVGSYRGRRHALGYPVRGQNTRSNAQTAKVLNRVDRRHFSSAAPIRQVGPDSTILGLLGRI